MIWFVKEIVSITECEGESVLTGLRLSTEIPLGYLSITTNVHFGGWLDPKAKQLLCIHDIASNPRREIFSVRAYCVMVTIAQSWPKIYTTEHKMAQTVYIFILDINKQSR